MTDRDVVGTRRLPRSLSLYGVGGSGLIDRGPESHAWCGTCEEEIDGPYEQVREWYFESHRHRLAAVVRSFTDEGRDLPWPLAVHLLDILNDMDNESTPPHKSSSGDDDR